MTAVCLTPSQIKQVFSLFQQQQMTWKQAGIESDLAGMSDTEWVHTIKTSKGDIYQFHVTLTSPVLIMTAKQLKGDAALFLFAQTFWETVAEKSGIGLMQIPVTPLPDFLMTVSSHIEACITEKKYHHLSDTQLVLLKKRGMPVFQPQGAFIKEMALSIPTGIFAYKDVQLFLQAIQEKERSFEFKKISPCVYHYDFLNREGELQLLWEGEEVVLAETDLAIRFSIKQLVQDPLSLISLLDAIENNQRVRSIFHPSIMQAHRVLTYSDEVIKSIYRSLSSYHSVRQLENFFASCRFEDSRDIYERLSGNRIKFMILQAYVIVDENHFTVVEAGRL